jgi:hypothetical protein
MRQLNQLRFFTCYFSFFNINLTTNFPLIPKTYTSYNLLYFPHHKRVHISLFTHDFYIPPKSYICFDLISLVVSYEGHGIIKRFIVQFYSSIIS